MAAFVLSMEVRQYAQSRIAKAELLYDEFPGHDEVIRRIDAVTVEDVSDPRQGAVRPARDASPWGWGGPGGVGWVP